MRICVLTTSYPRTPEDNASPFVAKLAEAFKQGGNSTTVVVPKDNSEPNFEARNGVQIQRFAAPPGIAFGAGVFQNLKRKPWLLFQLPQFLLQMRKEVLRWHAQGEGIVQANWIFAGIVAASLKRSKKIDFVVTIRGSEMRVLGSWIARLIYWSVFREARAIVTVSANFAEQLSQKFPAFSSKIRFIPNGVEVPVPTQEELIRFEEETGISAVGKNLISVANLNPGKRIEFLIELLKEPELLDYTLYLAGGREHKEYNQYLEALAVEREVASRVKFLGPLSPNRIPLLLGTAEVFISASAFEGRPNAMLEALAVGAPVVGSDIAPHRELLGAKGERGILFTDPRGAAKAIQKLEQDPQLRSQLVAAGKEFVSALTWRSCAEQYLKIFA